MKFKPLLKISFLLLMFALAIPYFSLAEQTNNEFGLLVFHETQTQDEETLHILNYYKSINNTAFPQIITTEIENKNFLKQQFNIKNVDQYLHWLKKHHCTFEKTKDQNRIIYIVNASSLFTLQPSNPTADGQKISLEKVFLGLWFTQKIPGNTTIDSFIRVQTELIEQEKSNKQDTIIQLAKINQSITQLENINGSIASLTQIIQYIGVGIIACAVLFFVCFIVMNLLFQKNALENVGNNEEIVSNESNDDEKKNSQDTIDHSSTQINTDKKDEDEKIKQQTDRYNQVAEAIEKKLEPLFKDTKDSIQKIIEKNNEKLKIMIDDASQNNEDHLSANFIVAGDENGFKFINRTLDDIKKMLNNLSTKTDSDLDRSYPKSSINF